MSMPNEVIEVRRQVHGLRLRDLLTTASSTAAALASTAFLFTIAPLSGALTFVLVAYVLFIVFYGLITAIEDDREAIKDRIASVIVRSAAVVIFSTLVFIVVFTIGRGLKALPNWNFFSEDMSLAGPLDPLSMGGILHAILGSLIQISIALAITIPLGLITAVFLNEMPGKYSRFVRTMVEAMTAVVGDGFQRQPLQTRALSHISFDLLRGQTFLASVKTGGAWRGQQRMRAFT